MWIALGCLVLLPILGAAVVRTFFYEMWIQFRSQIHMSMGHSQRALPLLQAQVDRLLRTKGENHLDTAVALYMLGELEYENGRRAEGRARVGQATAFFDRYVGKPDATFWAQLMNLGGAQYAVEEYAASSRTTRLALNGFRTLPGTKGAAARELEVQCLSNLGVTLGKAGQALEGATLLEEALEMRLGKSAENSHEVAVLRVNLGEAYINLQRWTEAERNLQQSIEVLQTGATRDAGQALDSLARLREEQQRWDEAEQLRTSALTALQRALGANHAEVAEQMEKQALVLDRLNRGTERDLYSRKAAQIREALVCTVS